MNMFIQRKYVNPREGNNFQIINCGSSLEMLYKEIDLQLLPVEYLPEDYVGPNGGTAAENVGELIIAQLFFNFFVIAVQMKKQNIK